MSLRLLLSVLFLYGVQSIRQDSPQSVGYGSEGIEWTGEVQRLSWKPRLYLIPHLLSPEECRHLRDIATPFLQPIGQKGGEPSKYGSSTGTFMKFGYDPIVSRIEARISRVAMIPPEYQEDMQILKYVEKEEFELHYDFYHGDLNAQPEDHGQRILTFLFYLSDVEEGGETVFTKAESKTMGSKWSACAKEGLAIRPSTGASLMFYNVMPSMQLDASSLHRSCPSIKGSKWVAVKWFDDVPVVREKKTDKDSST